MSEKVVKHNPKDKKGLFIGKSHAEGGIPSVVAETGQKIEIELNEYYICRDAYNKSDILEFKNKTNKEILDYIYTKYSCSLDQSVMNAGDFIVCKLVVKDNTKRNRKGTVSDIVNEMQGEKSCRVENSSDILNAGGKIYNKDNSLNIEYIQNDDGSYTVINEGKKDRLSSFQMYRYLKSNKFMEKGGEIDKNDIYSIIDDEFNLKGRRYDYQYDDNGVLFRVKDHQADFQNFIDYNINEYELDNIKIINIIVSDDLRAEFQNNGMSQEEFEEWCYNNNVDCVINTFLVRPDNYENDIKIIKSYYNSFYKAKGGEIETDSFKAWFGDSKVINEDGKPIVVYHGGLGKIEEFNEGFAGMTTADNEYGAFYFSNEYDVAEDYSRQAFIRAYQDNPEQLIEDGYVEQGVDFDEMDDVYEYVNELAEENLNVVKCYLVMENPVVIDANYKNLRELEKEFDIQGVIGFIKGQGKYIPDFVYDNMKYSESDIEDYREEINARAMEDNDLEDESEIEEYMFDEAMDEVLQANCIEREIPEYDGIIIKNVIDDIGDKSNMYQDVYIAVEPSKIKSVDNSGGFSYGSDNIYRAKGGKITSNYFEGHLSFLNW